MAFHGRSTVVRELIQTLGIEGCGGEGGGLHALGAAADVMAMLMDAGVVVDTGSALHTTAGCSREASV